MARVARRGEGVGGEMTWLIVLKFLQKYWKVGVVAVVVGSIVIGVASLYAA